MPLVNNVIYVDGLRAVTPASLEETFEALHDSGGVAWLALHRPDIEEMRAVAAEFNLHHLAVEDAISGMQRSKVEQYNGVTFAVLRPMRLTDGRVEAQELHLFVGPDFVISVRHGDSPDLAGVRARLEAQPAELGLGPMAIVYAVLDQLVDEYYPVMRHLMDAIDDVEDALFSSEHDVSVRMYALMRDVLTAQRVVHPIAGLIEELDSRVDADPNAAKLRPHYRDVLDHALRTSGQFDSFRDILASGLQLHIALVGQQQNEEMARMTQAALQQADQSKKVSAWAAILFTPTVIAGIYGMNFQRMPELGWGLGYPFALLLMLTAGVSLYFIFKRQHWL